MNRLFLALCFCIFSWCFGQNYEPLELAKIQLSKEYKKIEKFYGENFEGPNGNEINDSLNLSFKELYRTENYSVVNINILNNHSRQNFDAYFHFEKEKDWKITAFRALAMTGITQLALEELEKMSEKDIEKIIQSKDKDKIFSSREDYQYLKENWRLILSSDDEIIAHFQKNKTNFELLKNTLKEEKVDKSLAKKLYLSNHLNSYELMCDKCITLPIGGILDNTVGYFYIEDKADIPQPNPSRLIMIREIGNGWYLYKTT